MARECVERGYFLSFSGTVTFKNAGDLRNALSVTPMDNLLVETVWLSEEVVLAEGTTQREETAVVSPGIRVAFDVAGGLQVVPGIAYTLYLTPVLIPQLRASLQGSVAHDSPQLGQSLFTGTFQYIPFSIVGPFD